MGLCHRNSLGDTNLFLVRWRKWVCVTGIPDVPTSENCRGKERETEEGAGGEPGEQAHGWVR